MASIRPSVSFFLPCAVLLVCWAVPAVAFGAGNIASIARIEGQNWRHGDIEDTLLNILISRAAGGKKFSKLDVKRVYFGNWLRDYSQAVDVGTVKYVSAEAIRIILWVLGFMSFGYATKEFEVTTERLGCYRPEEHIDNPKDYAENEDARQYDRRLRAPVDERRELAIDRETGLKHYIASEHLGITTSAGLVRNLFGRSIQLGRKYAQSKDKADLYEALRLLGTGCHCLEDFSAHSNFTELALIELGERGVFPHVGRRTQVELPGARHPVYPIVTGTFGGVDFLHSVMGEFSDKATQSEIEELQGTIEQSQNSGQGSTSMLQDLLNQVPSGLFGDKDEAGKAEELQANAQAARLQNTHISPREPEEWTNYLQEVTKQIYPILEWHDEIMQSITETIENIPVLPTLIEQLQEQLNVFVFGLLAPFVLPIISQVKTELNTGSSEIIKSSQDKQLIVFHEDGSSDPTHSMLSKDHFSNVLNEPAGKIASQVLKWVVPQLIACWDDEQADVDRTLTRIVNGVFFHPALRDHGDDGAADGRRLLFGVVEKWWGDKDEGERETLRDQLSRDGVQQGRNHKEGVHDKGHGCGKPLGMPTYKTAGSSGGPAAEVINDAGKLAGEAVGGGALGGIVGGLVGGLGSDLLGDAFGGSEAKKKTYQKERYEDDGSYTQSVTQTGYTGGGQQTYGQAEYSRTDLSGGGRREEYKRYEQSGGNDQSGYGQRVTQESRSTGGGGYETTTERRYEKSGGEWHSEVRREGRDATGESYDESRRYEGGRNTQKESDSDEYNQGKKHKKKHHKHESDDEGQSEFRREGRDPSGDNYGESRRYEGGGRYKKESDSEGDKEGKKHKKKHHKHDSDSDNDKNQAYGERQRGYDPEERSTRERQDYGDEEGKKHKKKHHKHDSDSDNDKHQAYGERQRGSDPEERSTRERQDYGESRREYGGGDDSRQGGGEYQNRSRDDDSRPAYESSGYSGGGGGGDDRYGSGRQGYERGEGGYGGQREESDQRGEFQGEERTESYGEDQGYGRSDEDQEQRGSRYGYGGGDGY